MTVYEYGRSPEHWLVARDIASRIAHVDPADAALEQFYWMTANDFDVAFVKGGCIVFRDQLANARDGAAVADCAQPLPREHCVPAELSLSETCKKLAETSWLLLTDDREICGIVTREDLAKPAASAFAFAHLLTLERVLRRLVGSYTNRPWADDPPPLDTSPMAGLSATGIRHLPGIMKQVGRLAELLKELGYSQADFRRVGRWAIEFRRHLAHARRLNHGDPQDPPALVRFLGVQKLMLRAIALSEDRQQVWQAFADSLIREQASATILAGPDAGELPFAAPCFVITAWNPCEHTLDQDTNRLRNEMLLKTLELRTKQIQRVVGQSRCQTWQEESYLVGGLSQAEVLALAARYGQRAVFRLEPQETLVIDLRGQIRARACRKE